MVPIFAGVIVAGLGIGALLSALASRRPPQVATNTVAVHAPTQSVERTSAPAIAASAAPAPKVTPSPKPSPSTTATVAASEKPTPKPAPTASRSATPAATPRPRPTLAVVTAIPERTPQPPSSRPVSPPAAPRVPTAPPATRVAAATPAPVTQAPDALTAGAESLVRRYIDAVKSGDDAGAYAALGGTGGNRLYEQQYLDPTARITSMSSTRTSGSAAKVQVEMTSPKGQYFLTFTVDGTRITDHAIIPVGGSSR